MGKSKIGRAIAKLANTKPIEDWTVQEFLNLPDMRWDEEVVCNGFVIVPLDQTHDSGYKCMAFVPLDNENKPMGLFSGCSDALNLGGIMAGLPIPTSPWPSKHGQSQHAIPWTLDCLTVSKLLRVFIGTRQKIRFGPALSSQEVFTVPHTGEGSGKDR